MHYRRKTKYMILSKAGYAISTFKHMVIWRRKNELCWTEFNQDVWEFVYIVEVAESVNETITGVGLSKGAVSSLYAILFSSKPVPYLQYAAYVILSSEPIADSAFITEDTFLSLEENDINDNDPLDSSLGTKIHLREEISMFLEKLPFEILELDLVSPLRVSPFKLKSKLSFLFQSIYLL